MAYNKELIAKVLKQITEHPESHNQGVWWAPGGDLESQTNQPNSVRFDCESTGCVAGWAVALDSAKTFSWEVHIFEAAQQLLGLNYEEAFWLFSCRREHEDVVLELKRLLEEG